MHKLQMPMASKIADSASDDARRMGLHLNHDKPLVVSIRQGNMDPAIWHACSGFARPTLTNERILRQKDLVVLETGRNLREAAIAAERLGISIESWVPGGTPLQGGDLVRDDDGDIFAIVTVSGQDHIEVDQPLAEQLAARIGFLCGFQAYKEGTLLKA